MFSLGCPRSDIRRLRVGIFSTRRNSEGHEGHEGHEDTRSGRHPCGTGPLRGPSWSSILLRVETVMPGTRGHSDPTLPKSYADRAERWLMSTCLARALSPRCATSGHSRLPVGIFSTRRKSEGHEAHEDIRSGRHPCGTGSLRGPSWSSIVLRVDIIMAGTCEHSDPTPPKSYADRTERWVMSTGGDAPTAPHSRRRRNRLSPSPALAAVSHRHGPLVMADEGPPSTI